MSNELTRLFDELESTFHHPRVLGFGPLFSELRNYVNAPDVNYPKYNIIKIDEDKYMVEVAATGFDPDQIDVEVKNRNLSISGRLLTGNNEEYLHRGIARRDFSLEIRLGDNMEVGVPSMRNGLLTIPVTRVIPESEKPRKLKVINMNGAEDVIPGSTETLKAVKSA